MSDQPSRRQQIAQRFAEKIGRPVERVPHGQAHKKRLYRVQDEIVVVDVHYHTYIVVNGVIHHSEADATQAVEEAYRG